MLFIVEVFLVLLFAAFCLFGFVDTAVDQSLVRAATVAGDAFSNGAEVRAAARTTYWMYFGGIVALLVGRFLAFRGQPRNIGVLMLVPAATLLTGMGLALHWGYADHANGRFLYAPSYAQGVLWGGILAAVVMALPWDPAWWAEKMRVLLGLGAFGVMVALYFFGDAPGESNVKIGLFGVQPIEAVKVAFVTFLAAVLGRRAEQLRYQRVGRSWFQVPRPQLLLPAMVLLASLFAGLLAVRDLGPTLILATVFLALYFVVTRSWMEFLLAALVLPAMLLYLVKGRPDFLPRLVTTRLEMWLDPWLNGYTGGDQLASSLWAFAAGGFSGQGWGQAEIRYLPTGHTDLILSHLAEVAGLLGLFIYILALLAMVIQGFWVARFNRTPERMLLAFGLSLLLFAQWFVIFCGAAGFLPLTGVVVPFLSYGKTSMVVFLVVVALLVRLAVNGKPRKERDALFQLQNGIIWAALAVLVVGLGALFSATRLMLFERSEISVRGVLAMGRDESVFLRYDPRMRAIANSILRGEILDRNGEVIAGTRTDRSRTYPLGNAMGTLLGPIQRQISPPPWAVEGLLDTYLRGLAVGEDEFAVWIEKHPEARDRILFSVNTHDRRAEDERRARVLARPNTSLLFSRLAQTDFRPLLPVAHLAGKARREAIETLVNDVPSRTVQLTLDARLQQSAARILSEVVPGTGQAGAVVVLDVDTGQVLARAQWPDFDPANTSDWLPRLQNREVKFLGSYGPWRDKTGLGGLYQAGSIFKVVTAMAWVRSGMETTGTGCDTRGSETFACVEKDAQGPLFKLPTWSQAIHDSHAQPDGPAVDLAKGLASSCKVFFAQAGLHLGPVPFEELVSDGLQVDNRLTISPGQPGTRQLASTAFGQGAARMHAMEAARMVATVGSGGFYRQCPPTMQMGDACGEIRLIDSPSSLDPILSGMKRVIDSGTARRFRAIEGVRVYAKTGTATDPGRVDEVPYGLEQGSETLGEHSWFVALAEPEGSSACDPQTPGRLAVATVVPRGGDGSGPAMNITREVLEAARAFGYFGGDGAP